MQAGAMEERELRWDCSERNERGRVGGLEMLEGLRELDGAPAVNGLLLLEPYEYCEPSLLPGAGPGTTRSGEAEKCTRRA
jgi:hypothetical protein